jgi:phospholipase C
MRTFLLALLLIGCGRANPGAAVDMAGADGGAYWWDDAGAGVPADGGLPMDGRVKIKHVVIIIQENRTLDNLFNGFPGADTVTSGLKHDGTMQPLVAASLQQNYDISHAHTAFLTEYNGGGMNGFDVQDPMLRAYTYVPQSETKPYWDMAMKYVLADRMFQSNTGPSFVAHQYLTSGHAPKATVNGMTGFADENPNLVGTGGAPWGCDGNPMSDFVSLLLPNGTELKNAVYPCFDYVTLADAADRYRVTWHYYAATVGGSGYIWSAYQAISHIRKGPDWSQDVISPETTILSDIPKGVLAQITWVTPSGPNSDHLKSATTNGPHWVASIVNAIGQSPYWNDTAIFITWDDWGGLYDHVPPPQLDFMGLGFRVPLLVVSPYAKHGYVSHVQHEFGSILHFTEEVFGLPSLHSIDPDATDERADDLIDCFDFTQSPQPFVPIAAKMSPQEFMAQPVSNLAPDDDD